MSAADLASLREVRRYEAINFTEISRIFATNGGDYPINPYLILTATIHGICDIYG
jgi:hypothetical protein